MAAELISPDALKIGLVAILTVGYAAYKTGLLEKIKAARGESIPHYRPRPVYPVRRLRFEKAVLDVCGIDQLNLIRTTARLRRMGFWIVGDFTLPTSRGSFGPGEKVYARAFVHGEEAIYALAIERKGPRVPPPYIDFFSVFTDLTFLTATNSEEDDDPKRPGALRFHRLPGLLPEELFQHHRANLEALRNNWMKPVPTSRETFFSHYRQWLVVDSELRRARDEEVKKNQIARTIEGLPPLDIGPILRRYDSQRTPFEFGQKGGGDRTASPPMGSPTVVRDPERAPIRRRLPPTAIPGAGAVSPPAQDVASADPTFGDDLIANSAGFAQMPPEVQAVAPFPEIPEAHPLELLDRLDARTGLSAGSGPPVGPAVPPTRIQGQGGASPEAPVEDYPLEPSPYERVPEPGYPQGASFGSSGYLDEAPYDPSGPGQGVYEAESSQKAEPGSPLDAEFPDNPMPTFVIDTAEPMFFAGSDPEVPTAPPFATDLTPEPSYQEPSFPDAPVSPGLPFDFPGPPPSETSWPGAIPNDPLMETPRSGDAETPDPAGGAIRISLRQIQAWQPPADPPPATEVASPPPHVPIAPHPSGPDAPVRCPHCHARTLSRYSRRCHKCRKPLLEATAP